MGEDALQVCLGSCSCCGAFWPAAGPGSATVQLASQKPHKFALAHVDEMSFSDSISHDKHLGLFGSSTKIILKYSGLGCSYHVVIMVLY